jgi:hypothetical protein
MIFVPSNGTNTEKFDITGTSANVPGQMTRHLMTRLLVVLAMLLSIAGGPAVASRAGGAGKAKCCAMKCCGKGAECCAMKGKQPAQEQPVRQQVGRELAATVTAAPFTVLFTFRPAEPKRAPRALLAAGHAPAPLAAGCVWLI